MPRFLVIFDPYSRSGTTVEFQAFETRAGSCQLIPEVSEKNERSVKEKTSPSFHAVVEGLVDLIARSLSLFEITGHARDVEMTLLLWQD